MGRHETDDSSHDASRHDDTVCHVINIKQLQAEDSVSLKSHQEQQWEEGRDVTSRGVTHGGCDVTHRNAS